ncbi:MAG TPA: spore coat U domain-containing protein [Steroidobacteraceae bacterium]|nr:spore coat U domain-containing protein [Steroidobacteraceae bacterium]
MSRLRHALAAACALAVVPGRAPALAVNCTVSASGINFGIYDPLASAGDASIGTLQVTCYGRGAGAKTIAVGFSLGAGSSGNFRTRTMHSGANKLRYNIYWNPQYTLVAGDGNGGSYTGGAGPITVVSGRSARASGTMYGYVPAAQNVAAGSYTDMITVTVSY